MGQQVQQLAQEMQLTTKFLYHVDDANDVDAAIDFSHPDFFHVVAESIKKYNLPTVICTTGLSEAQVAEITQLGAYAPVLYTRNTSLGVTVLTHIVEQATRLFSGYDIEIIEKHHNQKVDSPSGTALQLLNVIEGVRENTKRVYGREGLVGKRDASEVGIHAVRGGSIVGEHTVLFASHDEVIELKHEAFSKKLFAHGAIKAVEYLQNQSKGQYTMKDVLGIE